MLSQALALTSRHPQPYLQAWDSLNGVGEKWVILPRMTTEIEYWWVERAHRTPHGGPAISHNDKGPHRYFPR